MSGADAAALANTANAVRPIDRHTNLSLAAYFAGWATSEAPLPALAALIAGNTATLRRAAPRERLLAATLTAANAAGLLHIRRNAQLTPQLYEAALRATLGDDYSEHIVQPDFPGPDVAAAKPTGLLRTLRIRHRLARHTDISYGPAGRANLLDVWSREDLPADGRAPVVLQMPGGAWIMGDKTFQAYPLLGHLVDRGWVCIAMNYRLSPRNTWPAQIVDIKRAIAWIKANIAGYGGDPEFLALTGGSAGGHLSSLAALTANDPAFQPGFEDADTTVSAAVPMYGAYDLLNRDGLGHHGLPGFMARHVFKSSPTRDRARFDAASPVSRVHAQAPPFLVAHGTNDSVIPVEQARAFAQHLRAASDAPVVWVELPGAQHAFDIPGSLRANHAAVASGKFLGYVYGEHRRHRS